MTPACSTVFQDQGLVFISNFCVLSISCVAVHDSSCVLLQHFLSISLGRRKSRLVGRMSCTGEGFELTASTQCISWGEFFDSKTQAVKKVWNWLRLGLVAPDLGMRLLYAFEEDAGTDMTILDHKLTLYEDVAACLF